MLNEAETTPPGQTFTPRQLRILKLSVVIMSGLLVLGFGLLLIGIYLQASKIGKAPASSAPVSIPMSGVPQAAAAPLAVATQVGAELHEAFADQGRLILHLKREGKSEFVVIDLATGRETQRITLMPPR
jgi:hypothetical protein